MSFFRMTLDQIAGPLLSVNRRQATHIFLFLACITSVLALSSSFGGAPNCVVSGTLYGPYGEALPGVELVLVDIEDAHDRLSYYSCSYSSTDLDGSFSFSARAGRTYLVVRLLDETFCAPELLTRDSVTVLPGQQSIEMDLKSLVGVALISITGIEGKDFVDSNSPRDLANPSLRSIIDLEGACTVSYQAGDWRKISSKRRSLDRDSKGQSVLRWYPNLSRSQPVFLDTNHFAVPCKLGGSILASAEKVGVGLGTTHVRMASKQDLAKGEIALSTGDYGELVVLFEGWEDHHASRVLVEIWSADGVLIESKEKVFQPFLTSLGMVDVEPEAPLLFNLPPQEFWVSLIPVKVNGGGSLTSLVPDGDSVMIVPNRASEIVFEPVVGGDVIVSVSGHSPKVSSEVLGCELLGAWSNSTSVFSLGELILGSHKGRCFDGNDYERTLTEDSPDHVGELGKGWIEYTIDEDSGSPQAHAKHSSIQHNQGFPPKRQLAQSALLFEELSRGVLSATDALSFEICLMPGSHFINVKSDDGREASTTFEVNRGELCEVNIVLTQ